MPKAMVLGVNGQDGSYLAEALLRRGYDVVGAGRQERPRYIPPSTRFRYLQLDLRHQDALRAGLRDAAPYVVFHVAAVHGASGFSYEAIWDAMMSVNVISVHTILEFARSQSPHLRLVYANSAKIFPNPLPESVDEKTPPVASCLYGIGKIAALELIRYYRRQHAIAGSNLILFNHESRRRPANYFLPTLARCLAKSMADPHHRTEIKTLDFYADWSSAEELMDIAVDVAERAPAEDFVLASGVTQHARTVVQVLFQQYGLDYSRCITETLPRQDPGQHFQVNLHHLQLRTGRRPVRGLSDIMKDLVAQALHGDDP